MKSSCKIDFTQRSFREEFKNATHKINGQNDNIMRKISLQYMVWKWFIYMYIITWIRVSTNIICCPTIWVVGRNVTLLLRFIAAGTTNSFWGMQHTASSKGSPEVAWKFVSIVEWRPTSRLGSEFGRKHESAFMKSWPWVATTTSALSPLPSQQGKKEDIVTKQINNCGMCAVN